MNNWRVAEPRCRLPQVAYAAAAALICFLQVAVRPRLRSLVGLVWAEIPAETCPAVQAAIGMARHLGSKSFHHILDIALSYLHSPQRQ